MAFSSTMLMEFQGAMIQFRRELDVPSIKMGERPVLQYKAHSASPLKLLDVQRSKPYVRMKAKVHEGINSRLACRRAGGKITTKCRANYGVDDQWIECSCKDDDGQHWGMTVVVMDEEEGPLPCRMSVVAPLREPLYEGHDMYCCCHLCTYAEYLALPHQLSTLVFGYMGNSVVVNLMGKSVLAPTGDVELAQRGLSDKNSHFVTHLRAIEIEHPANDPETARLCRKNRKRNKKIAARRMVRKMTLDEFLSAS